MDFFSQILKEKSKNHTSIACQTVTLEPEPRAYIQPTMHNTYINELGVQKIHNVTYTTQHKNATQRNAITK